MRLPDTVIAHLRGLTDWPDLTGTRYQVREVLGRGAMGTVYLAIDHALDREVALKVLTVSDPGLGDRLAREAKILARLEHPGLVPVHDYGVLADGRPYYVMKYVRGMRLDDFMREQRHDRATKLRIFLRICDTVAFAHASGVVHRDLKPENIMVGAFGEVLVLDWGVAKLPTDDPTDSLIAGTPGYMSPEQADGRADESDERADVYALGAMLTVLAGGTHPALDAIASTARASRPEDRYDYVAALADDIVAFLADEPVSAYHERLVDRVVRLVSKHRVAVSLVGAYVLARVLLLAFR